MPGTHDTNGWTAAILALAIGCAGQSRTWRSPLHRDHPLVGRLWDVERGRWIDEDTLIRSLGRATIVILGEKHDNADHHLLQARVVRALSDRRLALAFEMLEADRQAAIDSAIAGSPRDPDAIARAVDWGRSGWPRFELYRPIFRAGLDAGSHIVAANFPRRLARALALGGTSALDAAVVERLGLDRPLPPDVRAAMVRELREAHCGLLPEEMTDAMVLAQRARDAQMAERVSARPEGAILIAGAGHARRDRGVPSLLPPGSRTRSVVFEEVSPGLTTPVAYGARWGTSRPPFDYVWFTPVATTADPCAALRRH